MKFPLKCKYLYRTLSLAVAVILLWLAFRGVNWDELWGALSRAKPFYILLSVVTLVLGSSIRGLRWWILMSSESPVSVKSAIWASMAGQMVNSFIPARGGDLFRVAYIGHDAQVSRMFALGTTLVERIMDMAVITFLGMIAMSRVSAVAPWLKFGTTVVALCSLAGIAGIIGAVRFELPLSKLPALIPIAPGLRDRIADSLPKFILGLQGLAKPQRAVVFLTATCAIWLVDAFDAMSWALALDINLGFFQALLLLFVLAMTQIVPTTPGGLGINQVLALAVLTPLGFSQAQALAFILSAQALFLIVIAVMGCVAVIRLKVGRREMTPEACSGK